MPKRSSKSYSLVYRHFDLPEAFPLIGLLGRDWITNDAPITSLHFHNCLEIGYCYQGDGIFIIDDQMMTFHEKDISVVFPNQMHRSASHKNQQSQWKWLYLDPVKLISEILPVVAYDYNRFLYAPCDFSPVISFSRGDKLHAILEMLIEELESKRYGYEYIAKGLVLVFLIQLDRLLPQTTKRKVPAMINVSSKSIVPSIDLIARSYMSEISIEDLAEQCHLSTSHFRRLFKSMMNCGPLEYLNQMRVHAACNLLENTNESIMTIAMKTGFRSVSGLSRNFHAMTGKSPGQWRKFVRSKPEEKTNIL